MLLIFFSILCFGMLLFLALFVSVLCPGCPMLPLYLYCPFLIVPSGFSTVYLNTINTRYLSLSLKDPVISLVFSGISNLTCNVILYLNMTIKCIDWYNSIIIRANAVNLS